MCYGTPAAVSWAARRVDCFVVGSDHQMYHLFWDGSGWQWEVLGGIFQYGATATSWATNELFVAGAGFDSVIYYKLWTGTAWTNWTPIPSATIATPAAVAYAPNELALLAIGPDHHLYDNYYANSAFQGWNDLGPYCSGVAASSWGGSILIFLS